jgi:hypothetical protein
MLQAARAPSRRAPHGNTAQSPVKPQYRPGWLSLRLPRMNPKRLDFSLMTVLNIPPIRQPSNRTPSLLDHLTPPCLE